MPRALDLTGQRFGRLIATECLGSINGYRYWAVLCDCGNEELVPTGKLNNGHTKSCGCLMKESSSRIGKSKLRHGGRKGGKSSAEYAAWSWLRHSDVAENVPEWNDFQQFFKDIGWKPAPEYQLRRRDIRKPHGPTNTYWRDPNETQPTYADLGDEYFLDMRGAFARSVETIEEGARATECILR
ncbi:hypothetical protein N9A81_01890 [Synechococcus sp. AH-707-M23]|nr:hypothetical protein [Synechococcus sp. AH-707-M23]